MKESAKHTLSVYMVHIYIAFYIMSGYRQCGRVILTIKVAPVITAVSMQSL